MKKILLLALLGCSSLCSASHTFNCTIKEISTSMSYQGFAVVTLNCSNGSSSDISSGSGNCSSGTVVNNAFAFDTTDGHGKNNLSLAMMAFVSGKTIVASTYATCPVEVSSVPLLYGLRVLGQ